MTGDRGGRASMLTPQQVYALDAACIPVRLAFGGARVYQVGSSMTRVDFRDVDVRAIIDDQVYAGMFPRGGDWPDPWWRLVCVAVSEQLTRATGLNVDFQIQSLTAANAIDGPRNPLGVRYGFTA